MMKTEFYKIASEISGKETSVNECDWKTIEYVYTWHPAIDAVEGKKQIAYLYVNFGMSIINDMMNTAIAAEKAETALIKAKAAYESAKMQYEKLKKQGAK